MNRRKDLLVPKSPSLENEHTGPLNLCIDKSDNNDKNDDKIDDRGDEMRYYGVRIYPTKDVVMKRFQKGMCLSGFIFNKSQGLMYFSYSTGNIVAECVRFAYDRFPNKTDYVDGIQFTKLILILERD